MIGIGGDVVKYLIGMPPLQYDVRVDVLISYFVPAVIRALDPDVLADESLHSIVNLALAELVAAEMLGILARQDGRADAITLGDIKIEPKPDGGLALRDQGAARLAPFLRAGPIGRALVGSAGSKNVPEEA